MSPGSIRQIRKRLKLTQSAAAALVRVNPNTWARWERGESKPRGLYQRRTIPLLPRLARGKVVPGAPNDRLRPKAAQATIPRHSTGAALMKHLGTWVGKDLDRCLKLVYATRGESEF